MLHIDFKALDELVTHLGLFLFLLTTFGRNIWQKHDACHETQS